MFVSGECVRDDRCFVDDDREWPHVVRVKVGSSLGLQEHCPFTQQGGNVRAHCGPFLAVDCCASNHRGEFAAGSEFAIHQPKRVGLCEVACEDHAGVGFARAGGADDECVPCSPVDDWLKFEAFSVAVVSDLDGVGWSGSGWVDGVGCEFAAVWFDPDTQVRG